MNRLPQWARKPQHPKKVIATSRGWEVAHTGEVLVSVRGLDEKLKELFEETDTLRSEVDVSPKVKDSESESEEKAAPAPDAAPKPRKRPGRPPKKKKTEDTE